MMGSRRELSASFAKRGMKQNEFFTTCGVHLPISSEEIDRALISMRMSFISNQGKGVFHVC
jgi:hypothetical protein